jgi:hypothetical protein
MSAVILEKDSRGCWTRRVCARDPTWEIVARLRALEKNINGPG